MNAASPAWAASGADLLAACQTALETNFRGMKSKMCIWYVTPCDCDFGDPKTLPRTCVPESTSSHKLAFEVSEILKAIPEYQAKDAEEAATLILSEIYPCSD